MTTRLLIGDVFDHMAQLEDGSFDLIVTSPPFLALRSYLPDGHSDKAKEIGSEQTPAEYLDVLLRLTAEWRRLLTLHGSLAVELGDTYAGSGGAGGDYNALGMRVDQPLFRQSRNGHDPTAWPLDKSLTGIPTLYAWSLAYGRNLLTGAESPAGRWRIRNLKPWIRSNPPVGSLGDKERPATSYITVACTGRDRWFDLDAVRTTGIEPGAVKRKTKNHSGANPSTGWTIDNAEIHQNPGGAPPLDWVVDADLIIDTVLDARAGKRNGGDTPVGSTTAQVGRLGSDGDNNGGGGRYSEGERSVGARGVHIRRALQQAGILPQGDHYDISPRGYSGMTRPTTRLVPCGPHDGGQRTTSRGCPVHGDQPVQPHTVPDDAHAESPESHTPRNDDRHAQEQPIDSSATAPQSEPTTAAPSSDSPPQQYAPVATLHDSQSSRTVLASSTSPAGTPSAETSDRTARTSTSPSLIVPQPDMPLSSTSEAYPDGGTPETTDRTADTSSALSGAACTCSYHLAVKDDESTSHYAVWPPELVQRMINEMCPRYVCIECGHKLGSKHEGSSAMPGMRRTDREQASAAQRTTSDPLLFGDMRQPEQRPQSCINQGMDPRREGLHPHQSSPSSDGQQRWLRDAAPAGDGRTLGPDVETKRDRPSSEWDQGRQSDREFGTATEVATRSAAEAQTKAPAVPALRKTDPADAKCPDCGGPLRRGRILDPFVGSGTTLAVASGMGRDSVGIDLDPRSADLALQRVGMFLDIDHGTQETVA
jgi:hypothetical protein